MEQLFGSLKDNPNNQIIQNNPNNPNNYIENEDNKLIESKNIKEDKINGFCKKYNINF